MRNVRIRVSSYLLIIMFAQFRSRYPTGSLISELLAIDHGKYVVRVLVEVDSTIISSGLAAADTVELAEDQARVRSLQVLGIETSTALPPLSSTRSFSASASTPQFELNSAPEQPQLSASVVEFESEAEAFPPFPELEDSLRSSTASSSEDWLSATYINPSSSLKSTSTDSSSTSSTKGRGASLPPLPDQPLNSSNDLSAYPEEISPTPGTANKKKSKASLESTDYSPEIAKTDLELKRLGWTKQQGIDHLQKTYGKRSRHYLTEDELLDFLHYLECLPTPTPHADS